MSNLINDPSLPDIDPARATSTPDVDWGAFSSESDEPAVVAPSPTPTEPAVEPPPPAPAAAPSAPPSLPVEQAPVAEPSAPPMLPPITVPTAPPPAASAAEIPPVPSAQPAPPSTPAPSFEEQRATRLASLQERYAIPADKVPELLTEPEKAIPALLAAAHDNALMETAQMFVTALPQMVQQVIKDQANEEKARAEFYAAWPQLVGQDEVVQRVGMFYRNNVRKADTSPQEAIKKIGELTLAALGMSSVTPQNVPSTPPAQSSGFRPAGIGTPSGAPAKSDDNEFSRLLAEWEAEDNS